MTVPIPRHRRPPKRLPAKRLRARRIAVAMRLRRGEAWR